MKNFLAILSTVAVVSTASANEFGVSVSRDWGGGDLDRAGFSVRVPADQRLAFEVGVERNVQNSTEQDRYSAGVAYKVYQLGPVAVDGRFSVAYLHNSADNDGLVGNLGLGLRLPVTKTIAANAVLGRQFGHDSMSKFDTNTLALGLSYKF